MTAGQTVRIISGVLALLWGFIQAPFDHIHPEELEHEAVAAPVHLHGHEMWTAEGPSMDAHTADDDEVDVLWSIALSSHVTLPAVAELPERLALPDLARTLATAPAVRHRGHDPPSFSPKIPRAPPA